MTKIFIVSLKLLSLVFNRPGPKARSIQSIDVSVCLGVCLCVCLSVCDLVPLQGFYSMPLNRGLGDWVIGGLGDWGKKGIKGLED